MIDTIKPLGKNILIIPYKEEAKAGSLILTNQKEEFYDVIAIGEDVTKVNKGDVAIVNIYHSSVYRHPEFMIIDESAVMGLKL
jgi:co-chaperonin GroES (HSP10)